MLLNSLYWETECLRLQLTTLMLFEKVSKMENDHLRQIFNGIPLLKYRYFGSFLCNYTLILPIETFAIINTQPSNIPGEHWIMIANSHHNLSSANSLSRPSFLKQQHKQMMPQPLEPHPSVWGFYTIYAALHLFKFRQEENTGVHDVKVLFL